MVDEQFKAAVLKTLPPEVKQLDPSKLTLAEMQQFLGKFITQNPSGSKLWDIITCLRGPDSPSEKPSMTSEESSTAYAGRRKRKRQTVEVIRGKALLGAVGGSARFRTDINYVELPPTSEWDHFDKHVQRAANALGIEVKIQGQEKEATLSKKACLVTPVEESKEPGFPVMPLYTAYNSLTPVASVSQENLLSFANQSASMKLAGKVFIIDSKGHIKVKTILSDEIPY